MLGRPWPRFALEAGFLVAVAIAAGALGLGTTAIIGVMVVAYLAVVAVEWTAARSTRGAPAGAVAPEDEALIEGMAIVEPTPEPEAEPEPEPEPVVALPVPMPVTMPVPVQPRAWNLWELERLVRASSTENPLRAEEQSYLLVYLREFAAADGLLPVDFDSLVRESFGELVSGRA